MLMQLTENALFTKRELPMIMGLGERANAVMVGFFCFCFLSMQLIHQLLVDWLMCPSSSFSQWGTADENVYGPLCSEPTVANDSPGVGQNIATHASPAIRNSFLVLLSTFPVHSSSFFSQSFPCDGFGWCMFQLWSKIGHSADRHKQVMQVFVLHACRI